MALLPIIKTERLILRNIALSDVEDMYEYAKSNLVGPTAGWHPHCSEIETKTVIANFLSNQNRGDLGVWAIVDRQSGKMIGTIELYNYAYHFTAELGYSLSPDYWGNGLIVEAAKAVIDYGFRVLKLKRLEVSTFETNHQSIRVCEKLGLVKEGVLRNSYLRYDGLIFNKVVFSMTDTEYYNKYIVAS